MKRFLSTIHKIENAVLILIISYIVIIVCINVALRYIFSTMLVWSDEIVGYAFVFMGMLGSAAVIRDDSNIYIDILVRKIPKEKQKYLYVPVQVIIAFVLVFFIAATIKLATGNIDVKSPMNRISMAIPYGAMAFGLVIMLFELIVSFVVKAKNKALNWDTEDYDSARI